MLHILLRRTLYILIGFLLLSVFLVGLMRWVNPLGTSVMLERKVSGLLNGEQVNLDRRWRDWQALPDSLKVAVIAAEDQKFADHWGFDFDAIQAAIAHNERGHNIRGASTLSQQVAKNLFLWSGRSWLRKGLETWFTLLIELLWSKERILEVYLNSAEWGDGIFGAEAAAEHHFGIPAHALSAVQASLLAAVLPNPRAWNPHKPGPQVNRRAAWIRQQIVQIGGVQYLDRLSR